MAKRIIRLPEVVSRTGHGRTAIYDFMAEGTFPKSFPIGKRAVGWLEEEVEAWIDAKIAAREAFVRQPAVVRPNGVKPATAEAANG